MTSKAKHTPGPWKRKCSELLAVLEAISKRCYEEIGNGNYNDAVQDVYVKVNQAIRKATSND